MQMEPVGCHNWLFFSLYFSPMHSVPDALVEYVQQGACYVGKHHDTKGEVYPAGDNKNDDAVRDQDKQAECDCFDD